ncbi:MAG: hypothetical protein COA60_002485 [Robiginitomaculum sp.]|nr:hypothetical protein [Robiginitomaculum sp.]
MSSSVATRFFVLILAAVILLFSLWQATNVILRWHNVNNAISSLQNQPDKATGINPDQWLIMAGSHGAAGATLQARLRASARSADVSLMRVEIQPPNNNALDEVRATAQASGNIVAIAKFIHKLESQTPALVIERMRISKANANQLDIDLMLLARMSKRGEQ